MTAHLTYAEASTKIHGYMRQTLDGLPSGAGLTPLTADVDLVCSDDDGAPASTPVTIRPAAKLTGVTPADYGDVIDRFVAYWKAHGWHVALDQRPKDDYVVVKSDDDYELFLQVADTKKMITLGASTPCVAPKAAATGHESPN